MVLNIADSVEHRVPHIKIARGQVNLRPECILSLRELARLHPSKQFQALFHRTVPPRALCRGSGIPSISPELLRRKFTNIGQSPLDQVLRQFVGLLKIIRTIIETVSPVKAQPVDILLDGIHILCVLLGRVGVIHTQIADAVVLFRRTEINGQRLAMSDMEVAVGLWREPGVHLFPRTAPAGLQLLFNDAMNKIGAHGLFRHGIHSLQESSKPVDRNRKTPVVPRVPRFPLGVHKTAPQCISLREPLSAAGHAVSVNNVLLYTVLG